MRREHIGTVESVCEHNTSEPPIGTPPPTPLFHPISPHITSTLERGSFCLAHCSCGWSGPARRSRDRARTDAASHAPQS
ncbi:hypothetical protein ACFXCZ_34850 [Streptomyces sp. NPDC059396]|uniref:hypothetical protein n=1 Tax=Streptomyces sp. NPDC059396 TaxID=3346819 RepID=UPI0036CCFBB2